MAGRKHPWQSYKKEIRSEAFAKIKSPRLWKKIALYFYNYGPDTFLDDVFSHLRYKDKVKLTCLFLYDQLHGKSGDDIKKAVPLFHKEGSLISSLLKITLDNDGLWDYVSLQKALALEMLSLEELGKLVFKSKSLWVRRWSLKDIFSREDCSESIRQLRKELLDSKLLFQSLEDKLIEPIYKSLQTDEEKILFLRNWSGTGYPHSYLVNLKKTFSYMIKSSQTEEFMTFLFESILFPYRKVCDWSDKLKLALFWERCRKSSKPYPVLNEKILKAQNLFKAELEEHCRNLMLEDNMNKKLKYLLEDGKYTTKELAQCLADLGKEAEEKELLNKVDRKVKDFYKESDTEKQFLLLESMNQSAGETKKAREHFLKNHGSFSVELCIDKGSASCSTCKGKGEYNAGMEWRNCQACGGSGIVHKSDYKNIMAREYFKNFSRYRPMRVFR